MNRVANTSLLQRSTQSFHGPRPWMEGGKVLVGGFPTNVVNTRGRIFVDKVSETRSCRPGLEACLGDVLLVWCLDRLGRSMIHLVDLVEQLRDRSVGFRSLCDGSVDTTTASGELVFHIFSALAQFERRLIQERTKAGLAAARARGLRVCSKSPISGSVSVDACIETDLGTSPRSAGGASTESCCPGSALRWNQSNAHSPCCEFGTDPTRQRSALP